MARGHDPIRALRWNQRADDWVRLADHARESHVQKVCEQFATWSYDMAAFWGGVDA